MTHRQYGIWLVPAVAAISAAVASAPGTAHAQRAGTINIESTPPGATVFLDSETGRRLGVTPLRRVRIASGAHNLVFVLPGYRNGTAPAGTARRNETVALTLVQNPGTVRVVSNAANGSPIPNAEIRLDGNLVGNGNGDVSAAPGPHTIEVRAPGYQPYSTQVNVTSGVSVSVNAVLAAMAGTVRVVITVPSGQAVNGISVRLDNQPQTVSNNLATFEATPGQHLVSISAPGFVDENQTVTVQPAQEALVAVTLRAGAPTTGTLVVFAMTEGAEIRLDGNPMAGSPPTAENLRPGPHELVVTAPGRTRMRRIVNVVAGSNEPITLQDTDLPAAPQTNRLVVRTSTPGAHIFVNGEDFGTSVDRDNTPAGEYQIVVRAPNFEDNSQRCTVTATRGCDLGDVQLRRNFQRGNLRIALVRPLRDAVVTVAPANEPTNPLPGANAVPIGTGVEIPNVPAANDYPLIITVQAPRFQEFSTQVVATPGMTRDVSVSLRRAGGGPDLATRRSAISTWGASPLTRGDFALDLFPTFGEYYAHARATFGVLQYAPYALDIGVDLRTVGWMWELNLRVRGGYRFLDGLLALGAQLEGFAGLGISGQNNFGARGFAIASLHTLVSADEADMSEDPRETTNRLGSFSFHLRAGFEAISDNLAGSRYRDRTEMGTMAGAPRFNSCDPMLGTGGMAMDDGPCDLRVRNAGPMATGVTPDPASSPGRALNATGIDVRQNQDVVSGSQGTVRGLLGVGVEVGLGRRLNVFANIDRVLASPGQYNSRAVYQGSWFGNDSLTYINLGLTVKF